ncbi:MAG TPA: S41 family peptidase [Candidatus Binatia bacterium]|nr:S41 family peptidase [Candidatus Binatia bacterium]
MTSLRRDQALQMLKEVHDKVYKEYYDPTFHGLDFEARYREAIQKIHAVDSVSDALGVIAWMLDGLKDSHTFFLPPPRPFLVQDGWETSFIGDNCFVTAVKEGSDAAAKGLKPGDQVLAIEGFRPTRANWWKLNYAFHTLSPRSGMKLAVVSPEGQARELTVMSQVRQLPRTYNFSNGFDIWDVVRESENEEERNRPRMLERGDVLIWKLPRFMLSDDQIDSFLHKASAYKSLIVDLRGNPGGAEENLSRLLGGVFDHDVKIGDRTERKQSKPFTAKSRGGHAFSGKVIVLIDSRSASAAELFARVVQLEKRGTVIGDRSAGAVMEARAFPFTQGALLGTELPYGVEVTMADLKMTDGNSLENHGVIPDEILLPSPEELAAGADPQLARALQLAGVPMSSAAAGQLFPVRWR